MSLILSGTDGLSDVDGTAATPAIRGTDANTGIFFPAADTIAFSEGGVEAARIDSSGNLGVGTSSPTTRLTVAGTTTINTATDATAGLVVKTFSAAGGIQPIANFQRSDAAVSTQIGYNGTTGDCFFGTTSNHNLYFISNNTERVRIDTSGNVGIGTTSPAYRIDVNKGSAGILANFTDGVNANFQISTAPYITTIGPSAVTTSLVLQTSGTERARIDSSGNLTQTGVTTASGALMSSLSSGSSNTTVNSSTYNITMGSSSKVFWVYASNGDGCLVVTNYITATITIVGTGGIIVASASPTASQLGISKSANSHVVTFKTGSAATSTFAAWGVGSLSSSVS